MKFFAVLTILGGIIGALLLLGAFMADTHQAQAARAATAVGCVAIPYCVARAIQMFDDSHVVVLNRILKALSEVSDTDAD